MNQWSMLCYFVHTSTCTCMTLKPYLGAAKCIISTAQHARPNVIGHKEPCQKKISCHICCDGITQLHYVELEIIIKCKLFV